MTDSKTYPTLRVRMNHQHTARNGWELKETTVEIDGIECSDRHEPDQLAKVLLVAAGTIYNAGMREVALRNNTAQNVAEFIGGGPHE